MNYYIGETYRYPGSSKKFVLKQTCGFGFEFECGKKITDNVFMDLIRVKTGIQVYMDNQIEIKF